MSQTGQCFNDDHILCRINIRDALTENVAQTRGEAVCRPGVRGGVLVLAGLRGERLDKPQLLDIARNGRLRGVVAKCPQMCGQILLRFNLKPVDEIEDFCLSLKLHRSRFPLL